jgi:hypothetical protein
VTDCTTESPCERPGCSWCRRDDDCTAESPCEHEWCADCAELADNLRARQVRHDAPVLALDDEERALIDELPDAVVRALGGNSDVFAAIARERKGVIPC